MGDVKMSSDEVPHKFLEWLLGMGCPPDKVPSLDKVSEMCRGQYYMVWRSLMEHVEPKDCIKSKRLQVFCDDMRRCRRKNTFNERDLNAITPEELNLWRQHTELREKLNATKARLTNKQRHLNQVMDKISSKLSQRSTSRLCIQDMERHVWLLQEVADELRNKKTQLEQARAIADSMCCVKNDVDIESNLDKCMSLMGSHIRTSASVSLVSASNPVACSSLASSSEHDSEEQVAPLVGCRGDSLWPQVLERRAALTHALTLTHTHDTTPTTSHRVTPQSVLAQTAALHCSLALEATKNRVHIEQTRKRLVAAVNEHSSNLSGESCELLVQRCVRARAEARVNALRCLLEQVTSRSGMFATEHLADEQHATGKQCAALDKAITSKKAELQRLTASMWATERKIQVVRECLLTMFKGFHTEVSPHEYDKFKGQLVLPQESILTLRQFYETNREKRKNKLELSMNLDVSDNCSFSDPTDTDIPKFVEELRIYLKRFNLEKNRKLVLDSGDKIWIFESLQSSLNRLRDKWQMEEVSSSLMCPSVSLTKNLTRLLEDVQQRDDLHTVLREFDGEVRENIPLDIKSKTEEGDNTTDNIKKRLNANLFYLQKAGKTLDLEMDYLKFWSENQMRKHISNSRTIDGMTYKQWCRLSFADN